MTSQDLSNNFDTLENKLIGLSGQPDLNNYMMPDSEIIKNLIQLKSGYSSSDVNQMVDGKKSNSELSDSAKKIYPLPKKNPFYTEVKDMKSELRIAFMQFLKESKSLSEEFINNSILSVSQLSAITIMVSAPPFNIPAAVSLSILMIQEVDKMVDRIIDIINYIEPLKKLEIVVSPSKMDMVTTPLNAAILIISGLISTLSVITLPLKALKSLIQKLTDPKNTGSSTEQLKKQITDKSDEIKKLISNGQDHSGQDEDLNNLTKSLNDIQSGKLNSMLVNNKLPDDTTNAINKSQNVKPTVQNYIYDVQLPDGTILTNLTDNDLKKLSQSYNIVNKT